MTTRDGIELVDIGDGEQDENFPRFTVSNSAKNILLNPQATSGPSQQQRTGGYNFDMNREYQPDHSFMPETPNNINEEMAIQMERDRNLALVPYNRCMVGFLFMIIFLNNLIINIDHGSLPAGSVQIKE